MCKDKEKILRHKTLLKAPMPISVPFHSLSEKQEVRAAHSAGSLSLLIPNIWFQSKGKKELNDIFIFNLTPKVRFCMVYACFFHSAEFVLAASVSYGIRA